MSPLRSLVLVAMVFAVAACESPQPSSVEVSRPSPSAVAEGSEAPSGTPSAGLDASPTPLAVATATPSQRPLASPTCDPATMIYFDDENLCVVDEAKCPPERVFGNACANFPTLPAGWRLSDRSPDGFGGQSALFSNPNLRGRKIKWETEDYDFCTKGAAVRVVVAQPDGYEPERVIEALRTIGEQFGVKNATDEGPLDLRTWQGRYISFACPSNAASFTAFSLIDAAGRVAMEGWAQSSSRADQAAVESVLAGFSFAGGTLLR